MLFEELKIGLQMISPQGDIFEVCAISNSDKTVLVKVNEFSTRGPNDEDPMDRHGREFTGGNSGWITEHGKNVMKRGFYEVHYGDFSLWYDDIPNFEEGDIVKDLDGNKYKIVFVCKTRSIPDKYKLKLLDIRDKYSVRTSQLGIELDEVGYAYYIYNTQNDAVRNDDYNGIYQLFATELKLVEQNEQVEGPANIVPAKPAAPAVPAVPANAKRPSIEEIREITAKAADADLDKVLDVMYPKILDAAERGEHTVSFNTLDSEMSELAMFSPKYKIFEHFSAEGYKVLERGGEFEIKW